MSLRYARAVLELARGRYQEALAAFRRAETLAATLATQHTSVTSMRSRMLQTLAAPRGALLYPRLSREEFEGRFLGLMPYLELKGEGNRSMAGN